MQVVRFNCPHCAADLRVRDEEFFGRRVECPECGQPFVVSEEGRVEASTTAKKTPTAKSATGTTSSSATNSAPTANQSPGEKSSRKPFAPPVPARALPPIALVYAAAALLGVSVLGYVGWRALMRPALSETTPIVENSIQAPQSKNPPADVRADRLPASPAAESPKVSKPATVQDRLAKLAALLADYRSRNGHFPAGTARQASLPPNERLSWLAELAAASLFAGRSPPLWNESWRSPRNDRFVRQRIPEFLNPNLSGIASRESYPATNFVGVAGVGADAADLPVDHPRAGIFGNARTTRLDEIRDGTSNTLMVVGVAEDVGAWAAGGTATVRPFTREPYINGPDGFGTGERNRMTVMMADGSVRQLAAATDPVLVRRMAAMADGLPLDPRVPGEPGSNPPKSPQQPLASVNPATDPNVQRSPVVARRPAISAQATNAKPTVNIAAALRQRILRFEQPKPVPVRDVLVILEEMLGVTIDMDKTDIPDLDTLLQTPVTFDLRDVTLGDLLKAVLGNIKLTFETDSDSIKLRKFPTAPIH